MTDQTQTAPQIDPQTPVTLTLDVGAVNGIIIALAKLPYEQTAGLIDAIRAQAVAQIQKPQVEEAGEA